jgi:hypothetical protein
MGRRRSRKNDAQNELFEREFEIEGTKYFIYSPTHARTVGRDYNPRPVLADTREKAVATKNIDVLHNRLKAYEMYAAKLEKRCKDLTFLAILFACTTLSLLAFVGLKGI